MVTFDHQGRIRRYQELLKNAGNECGLVLKAANVRYLSGFWGYSTRAEYSQPRRLICLVVPAQGEPLLVVPKIEFLFAQKATAGLGLRIRRHVEWKEQGETEDSLGIVRAFLRENGITSGRVGIERDYLSLSVYDAFAEALQDYELVSSANIVERMRVIKDPVEIQVIRRCGELAVEQLEVEIAAITRGGYREFEVAMIGWEHVVRRCADVLEGNEVNSPIGEGVQLITSGPRLAMAHGSASNRLIEPSDVVMMDFCRVPYLLGYRLGLGRVVTQRQVTSEEEDIEATVQRAYQAGLASLRPGVTCSEVDTTFRRVLIEGGLGRYIVHRSGRGVGLEMVELPELKEGIETRLEAGMVLGIEPSIYRPDFASRVESTVLITANGPEVLTRASNEIRRIFR